MKTARFWTRLVAALPAGFVSRLSWQYAGTIVTVVTGFAYSIVVARTLGVSSFGIIALANAIASLVAPFLHGNMRDYLVRYLTLHATRDELGDVRDQAVRAGMVNAVSTVLYCLGMTLCAGLLARLWSSNGLLAGALPLAALSAAGQLYLTDAAYGVLRGFNHVRTIVVVQIVLGLSRLGLSWLALRTFHVGLIGVLAVSALLYVAAGLILVAAAITVLRKVGALSRPVDGKWRIAWFDREQWGFLRRNYLANLFSIPTRDLDVNILGLFAGLDIVGIYRMAKNFVAILWTITDPIHLVLYPEYARFWHRNAHGDIRKLTLVLMLVLGVTAVVILGLSSLVVPRLIVVFAGAAFAHSGLLYIEMVWSIVIWLPMMWLGPLLLAAGRNDISLRTAYASGIISVLLYLVAGHFFGVSGMAIANSANFCILVALQGFWGWRAGVVKIALLRPRPDRPSPGELA